MEWITCLDYMPPLAEKKKRLFKDMKAIRGSCKVLKARKPNSLHSDKKLEYSGSVLITEQ